LTQPKKFHTESLTFDEKLNYEEVGGDWKRPNGVWVHGWKGLLFTTKIKVSQNHQIRKYLLTLLFGDLYFAKELTFYKEKVIKAHNFYICNNYTLTVFFRKLNRI
jgi:hypothetical protein